MTEIKTLKNNYPFKLGCTSYVYPGDIAFNAERLAPVFDDIELVFFQSADACNFPDQGTISLLQNLSETYGTTYTVHFPIDKKAGSDDESERNGFLNQVKTLLELTCSLKPFGYILHLEGINRQSSNAQRQRWLDCAHQTCEQIASINGLDVSRVCVENLDYPLSWHENIVAEFGFSLCADLGHMFLYNEDAQKLVSGLLQGIRVIHLHGVSGEKDHVSLKRHDYGQLKNIVRQVLSKFPGLVTIETFNESDTFESAETIKNIWQK